MFYFLVVGVLLFLAVGAALAGAGASYSSDKRGFFLASAVSVVLAILATILFSATVVGARSVGVETAFGKYRGTLTSGLNWTAPWASVEQFSTRVQFLDIDGDNAAPITFDGGGGGAVEATPRWRIDESGAEVLWQKYKTFDNVRDQLVLPSVKEALRVEFGKYPPNEARDGKNLRQITENVLDDLNAQLKDDGVVFDSLSIKNIKLDAKAQESLDKIVTANNDIQRAEAERTRAKIDAETARIRNAEGVLEPGALARYCLEIMNAWDVNKNGPLPATFNCVVPSGAGVVISTQPNNKPAE